MAAVWKGFAGSGVLKPFLPTPWGPVAWQRSAALGAAPQQGEAEDSQPPSESWSCPAASR